MDLDPVTPPLPCHVDTVFHHFPANAPAPTGFIDAKVADPGETSAKGKLRYQVDGKHRHHLPVLNPGDQGLLRMLGKEADPLEDEVLSPGVAVE